MKIEAGDYIKVRKDFITEGCEECMRDLEFWTRHRVKVEGIQPRGSVLVRTRTDFDGWDFWTIEAEDIILANVFTLENK